MKPSALLYCAAALVMACGVVAGEGDPFSEAESLLDSGRFEEALAQAERAVALDPEDGRGLLLRGRALSGLGRFEAAASAFQESMLLSPFESPVGLAAHEGFVDSLLKQSRLEEGRGMLQEALQTLNTALVMDAENTAGIVARARLLESLGRQEEALDECATALKIDPENPAALERAAALNLSFGRIRKAEDHLTRLCTKSPYATPATLSWARYNLGAISLERGDRRLAFEHFAAAAELDPKNEPARDAAFEIAAFREQARKAAGAERTLLAGCIAAVAAWIALAAILRFRYF